MRNRQLVVSAVEPFVFAPKIEYQLVAESFDFAQDKLREANQSSLTFPVWCPGRDLNPHALSSHGPQPCVYTNSTTWADTNTGYYKNGIYPKLAFCFLFRFPFFFQLPFFALWLVVLLG